MRVSATGRRSGCSGLTACASTSRRHAPRRDAGSGCPFPAGSRSHIAAGTLPNTDENLAKWIQHPQAWKPGVLMPDLGLTDPEAQALVAYLRANQ